MIAHSVHHPRGGAIPPTHEILHVARVVMILTRVDRVHGMIMHHHAAHATMIHHRAPYGLAMMPHAVTLQKMRIPVASDRATPLVDHVRATTMIPIPHADRQRIGVMNVMAHHGGHVPAMRTIPLAFAKALRAHQDDRDQIPRETILKFRGVHVRVMAMTMGGRAVMTPAVAGVGRVMILTMRLDAVLARTTARPDVRVMPMKIVRHVRAAMTRGVAGADRAMPMGRNRVAAPARIMTHLAQRAMVTMMAPGGGRARPWMIDLAEAVTRSLAASGAMKRVSVVAS